MKKTSKDAQEFNEYRALMLREYNIKVWEHEGVVSLKPMAKTSTTNTENAVGRAIRRAYDYLGKKKEMKDFVLFLRQNVDIGITLNYKENPAYKFNWVVEGI
jgi:hypothetical protein